MVENLVTEKRKHTRQNTWQAVKVLVDDKVYVCDVIQISNSGAAIEVPPNLIVRPNQKIKLAFVNGAEVEAIVVWAHSGKFGVSFEVNFLSHSDFIHYDYMGYDLYRQMVKIQKLRTTTS